MSKIDKEKLTRLVRSSMNTRKLNKEQWDYEVRRALKIRKTQQERFRKQKYSYYRSFLTRIMPLPYVLGGVAAILLLALYGWKEFFKFFLSWVVSVTIIAMLAYHLWKRYEQDL